MTQYAFNRRVIEDQIVYVNASSLAEAWRKVRSDEGDDTCDPVVVKQTFRRLEQEP